MAENNDRKVKAVKEAAAKSKAVEGGDTNTIVQPVDEAVLTAATTPCMLTDGTGMIRVPHNCPKGYKCTPDGVCRKVVD